MSFRKFIHNNLVAILIIPTVIGIHFAVDKIQQYDHLVAEHERKDLPIVQAAKGLKEKVIHLMGSDTDSSEIQNTKES